MKLTKFKDILKREKTDSYNFKGSEESTKINKDYTNLLMIERLSSGDKIFKNSMKDSQIPNHNSEIEFQTKKISYIPKRKIEFIPSNLMSYGNPNQNLMENLNRNSNSPNSNFNFKNILLDNYKNIDIEYMNFKTNFILRFAKNISNYDKIIGFLDSLTYISKTNYREIFFKLKNLSEKKDKILFETKD